MPRMNLHSRYASSTVRSGETTAASRPALRSASRNSLGKSSNRGVVRHVDRGAGVVPASAGGTPALRRSDACNGCVNRRGLWTCG